MLTAKEIIMATIEAMDNKQRNRILNTNKEYVRVECSIFNAGVIVDVKCTDKLSGVHNSNGYNYIVEADCLKKRIRNYIKNNS